MKSIRIHLGVLLAIAATIANAAEKKDVKPATPAATTNGPSVRVIAYYFHGTVRCETCQKIERQAREVIEREFKSELTAKRLVFKPVNYDLPENAHLRQDYKLPCPSLVIVRLKDGKGEKWKLLGETWQLVGEAGKFNKYVVEETRKLLDLRE
jgi:hypothetical protein